MIGLMTFLLFGGFFFLMMRFGCGAHAGHGGHQQDKPVLGGAEPTADSDPVCGMSVPRGSGYATMYHGAQYRFCSSDCLHKFEAVPETYLVKRVGASAHAGHRS